MTVKISQTKKPVMMTDPFAWTEGESNHQSEVDNPAPGNRPDSALESTIVL